jgi:hypothetical protein
MNDKVAWVHPNPLLSGFVVLPDGYQMSQSEAEALGFTVTAWPDTAKVAAANPYAKDSVVLSRGVVVARETANEAGFTLSDKAPALAPQSKASAWRAAIFALPEAQARPSAVAEIVTSQKPENMSVERASAFLRGLPLEVKEEQKKVTIENQDPRAARLAEINGSMRAFNAERGYTSKPKPSVPAASVEPAKLKRLTEIRLAALDVGAHAGNMKERNNLRYALAVHEQTGAPLLSLFTQFGIDTSKIIRNNA